MQLNVRIVSMRILDILRKKMPNIIFYIVPKFNMFHNLNKNNNVLNSLSCSQTKTYDTYLSDIWRICRCKYKNYITYLVFG